MPGNISLKLQFEALGIYIFLSLEINLRKKAYRLAQCLEQRRNGIKVVTITLLPHLGTFRLNWLLN